MKAIILAAGRGTRLNHYTADLPKGMLSFAGETLIERQIRLFNSIGINDIIIITGYKSEKIKYNNARYYKNVDYENTNMLESLFTAENEFNEEIIITYSDIVFEKSVLVGLSTLNDLIIVTVDKSWKNYWLARYDTVNNDTESLILKSDNTIKEIGEADVGEDKIEGRYVGLLKLSRKGLDILSQTYHKNKKSYWDKPWGVSKNIFQKAYITDILNEMVNDGIKIDTYFVDGGWLEFDTNEDYIRMEKLYKNDGLNNFINLDK